VAFICTNGPPAACRSAKVARSKISRFVVLDCELGPIEDRDHADPVVRTDQLEQQTALDVPPEEAPLELGEDAVAVQCVVGRGEAPARHRRDEVHLVEQALALTVDDDLGIPKLLKDAVGKRRRPRAAAGEGQHQEHVTDGPPRRRGFRPVAEIDVPVLQRYVGGTIGRTPGDHDRCREGYGTAAERPNVACGAGHGPAPSSARAQYAVPREVGISSRDRLFIAVAC